MTNGLYVKKNDVAGMIGINVRTLDRWIANGSFPKGKKMGGRTVWLPTTVNKWLRDFQRA